MDLVTDTVGRLRLPRRGDFAPGPGAISFRPHVLRLQDLAGARDPALLWLEDMVEAAEFLGETTRYQVRVAGLALTADQAHLGGMRNFSKGSRVALGVAPAQLRCLRD